MIRRTDQQIKDLILDTASDDDRIRAVLLNGSRANPNIPPDDFQDFGVVFIVHDLESLTSNHNWIDVFGERIYCQMPDQMTIGERQPFRFSFLILLKVGT